jgi:hypothetical protein
MQNIGKPVVETVGTGEVRIFDDPTGIEIYAEGAHGIFTASGNVTISFYAPRSNNSGQPDQVYRTIVGRITMPAAGAQTMAVTLFDFLKQVGLSPEPLGRAQ